MTALYPVAALPVTAAIVFGAAWLFYPDMPVAPTLVAFEAAMLVLGSLPAFAVALLLRRRGWRIAGASFVALAVLANLALKQWAAAATATTQFIGFTAVMRDGTLTSAGLAGYALFFLVVATVQLGTLRIVSGPLRPGR